MIKYPSSYKKSWAVYLPSLQDGYLKDLSRDVANVRQGSIPKHIPNFQCLNYWNGKGKFYWPNLLFSPGQTKFKANWQEQIERHKEEFSEIFKRDADLSYCMVDSGGFQIATDKSFTFIPYNDEKLLNVHRLGLLRWQEAMGDVAISFEAPTLTSLLYGDSHPRLKTPQDCLDFTLDSMAFAKTNQAKDMQWVVPIQGGTLEQQIGWYDAVKEYKPYAYALACSMSDGKKAPFRNANAILNIVRHMIEDGAFDYCRHLHLLGIVGPIPAIFATALKRYIPATEPSEVGLVEIDETVEVTFDAASYSLAMTRGQMHVDAEDHPLKLSSKDTLHIPQDEVDNKTGKLIKNVSDVWADRHEQIKGDMRSPLLNGLRYSDMVGWTEEPYKKTGLHNRVWDPFARTIMTAQNVWAEVQQVKDTLERTELALAFNDFKYAPNDLDDPKNWEISDKQMLGHFLVDLGKEILESDNIDKTNAEIAIVQLMEQEGVLPPGIDYPATDVTLEKAVRIFKLVEKALRGDVYGSKDLSKDDKDFLDSLF